jgi:hypothetical protein
MTAERFLEHGTSNKRTNPGVDAGLVDGDDDFPEACYGSGRFGNPVATAILDGGASHARVYYRDRRIFG